MLLTIKKQETRGIYLFIDILPRQLASTNYVKVQSSYPNFIFQHGKDNVYANACLQQAYKRKTKIWLRLTMRRE